MPTLSSHCLCFFAIILLFPSTGLLVKSTIYRLFKGRLPQGHAYLSSIKSHLSDKVLKLGSVGVETIDVGVEGELAEGLPGRLVPVDVHWVQWTNWGLMAH